MESSDASRTGNVSTMQWRWMGSLRIRLMVGDLDLNVGVAMMDLIEQKLQMIWQKIQAQIYVAAVEDARRDVFR